MNTLTLPANAMHVFWVFFQHRFYRQIKKHKYKNLNWKIKCQQTAYCSLHSRLSVLDFLELFHLALIHVFLQFPSGVLIWQRAPLHQVVDDGLIGRGGGAITLHFSSKRSL